MTQGAPSRPPEVKPEAWNKVIDVKLVRALSATTWDEVFFKTRLTTKVSKMKATYANKVGIDSSSIRLMYHDAWIGEDDTPESLQMEDNDVIDVLPMGGFAG